jgi:hypothetical protein
MVMTIIISVRGIGKVSENHENLWQVFNYKPKSTIPDPLSA